MNTLIVLLSLFAVVSAKVHEFSVGCHQNSNEALGQFGPDQFLQAVAAANMHLDSKITVCCVVVLNNTGFDTSGPVPIVFQHNIELVGARPHHGHSCPDISLRAHKAGSFILSPSCAEDQTGRCAQMTATAMNAENRRDDHFEFPHAWIESFGYWFWFTQKATIHRLGFVGIPDVPAPRAAFNASAFFSQAALKQGLLNCQNIQNPAAQLPNAIISATCHGSPSEELSISESVFVLDWDVLEDVVFDGDFLYAWAFVSFAQEFVMKKSVAEALDFHLLARFASVTEIEDCFLVFFWDLANLLEEQFSLNIQQIAVKKLNDVVKRQIPIPFEVPAQILLKIEDTDLIYAVVDQSETFPIAYADLGLVSTILDVPPEIHNLRLDEVKWFNFERVIAAGNLFSLEVYPGFDYQEAKVEDEVLLTLISF